MIHNNTAYSDAGLKEDYEKTNNIGYWVTEAQEKGTPKWPVLFALYQIAKVLWRIRDLLDAIYMTQPDADDIGKAVAKHLAQAPSSDAEVSP